jgi:predicted amidohydrolase YtcJ
MYRVIPLVAFMVLANRMLVAETPRVEVEQADLIIENAKIYHPGTKAVALAIRSNRIIAVGSRAEIEKFLGPQTRRLDAKECSVTPGFNDSHVHFLSGSLGLTYVDLSGADSLEAIEVKIREYVKAHPKEKTIYGRGWVYGAFPGGLPHKDQLDKIEPNRPTIMKCYDGNTLWVNSAALTAAKITHATPNPEKGEIVKDPVTKVPTGVLKESAQELMNGVIPEPTMSEKLEAMRIGIATAHRFGVTSAFDANVELPELEVYEALRKTGELSLRFNLALNGEKLRKESDVAGLEFLRQRFSKLNVSAVKLFVDGVIESHTAALLSEYANRPSRGMSKTNQGDLNRVIEILDERGWQILVHAVGDSGIRMTLDAFERARKLNPHPKRPSRHRIEHIETISHTDIGRIGSLGVIASMQPYHADPNSNIFEIWAVNLGPERASRAWVWKSIKDAGGQLAFGSDWPVAGLDPRLGMHTALTRQTLRGQPAAGFIPEQRLPLEAVLDAYTRGSAFADFAEDQKGTLAVGLLADVVVWDRDLFSAPVHQVHTAKVLTTIMDGRVVYQAN